MDESRSINKQEEFWSLKFKTYVIYTERMRIPYIGAKYSRNKNILLMKTSSLEFTIDNIYLRRNMNTYLVEIINPFYDII